MEIFRSRSRPKQKLNICFDGNANNAPGITIVAETRLPLQLPSLGKRKGSNNCSLLHHHHQETTTNNKKLKTSGSGSDIVVDRAAMLKLKYFDVISIAQNYVHEHEDEEAAATRKTVQVEAQMQAARLELENIEKSTILQVEDNILSIEQLEDLAGCSFSFVIDPKISGDGDDGRVTMCSFQGSQYYNPPEKILGLTVKDHQDKLEGELHVMKKLQENPHHRHEREEEEYRAYSWTRTWRLLQLQSQRQAARLELHKIENSADIQDNFRSIKQLQELAGCCLSFMIDPSLDDDAAAKVTMGAFQGTQFWNPLEKIGIYTKD
ncbi:hypothetical protein WN943_020300 [Citrus x changshan-huyou]